MGGRIEVESSEGRGSSFTVHLPGLPARDSLPSGTKAPSSNEPEPASPGARSEDEDQPREIAAMPPEERDELRRAIERRISPEWRKTQEVKMLENIVSLAERVQSLGAEFGVEALTRSGHELADAAREFDVDAMEEGFDRFRSLARTLEIDLDGAHPK
jgi:hypothetical protein